MTRRDSILKHSGSIKNNEKRVSIKHDQPVFVEYLSEKRNPLPTVVAQPHAITIPATANARPASLILSGRGDRPMFKLVRSTSIERGESIEKLDVTILDQHNSLMLNNLNVAYGTPKDDDDESIPLVQTNSNGTSRMTQNNSGNL